MDSNKKEKQAEIKKARDVKEKLVRDKKIVRK